MATTAEIIEQLKYDRVVLAIPKLRNLVKKLETNYRKEEKINLQNCNHIAFMADGLEYDEAYRESRKPQ